MADAALAAGGRVVGVIPRFMYDLEWGHGGLTEVDGIVALPGGTGTLEELLEALTWKRLGPYLNPIVIVNQGGYFNALIEQFQRAVEQRFMDRRHLDMWTIVPDPSSVLDALLHSPDWNEEARRFATV
jgi:predicted Rossmann-fold nucleotide-binding protein